MATNSMPQKVRALVLEDVAGDLQLIKHEFCRHGLTVQCHRVDSREEFVSELLANTPDLVLSDHGVPGFDGLSALAITRSRFPDLPFVFVSGSEAPTGEPRGAYSSADGFVPKDDLGQLVPAVERAVSIAQKRAERRRNARPRMLPLEINLSDVVRQAFEEGLRNSSGRRVEWVFRPLPKVIADPALLGEAIQTLVANALEFTADRHPARIEISTEQTEFESTIRVQDNRQLPNPADLEKVFGTREHTDKETEPASSGNPLASVQWVVDRHGGRVWAEACQGGGARFCIALPRTIRLAE